MKANYIVEGKLVEGKLVEGKLVEGKRGANGQMVRRMVAVRQSLFHQAVGTRRETQNVPHRKPAFLHEDVVNGLGEDGVSATHRRYLWFAAVMSGVR